MAPPVATADVREYARLLTTSVAAAEKLLTLEPCDPRGEWMRHAAYELAAKTPVRGDKGLEGRRPVKRLFKLAEQAMSDSGIEVGEQLWTEIAETFPMRLYGDALRDEVLSEEPVSALEVNRGQPSPIAESVESRVERFGLIDLETVERNGAPATTYEVVYAENVVNRAADRREVLARLFDAVEPGGRLVIVEGTPEVRGYPWALTWVFGLDDEWRSAGGFEPLWYWQQVGPTQIETAATVACGGHVCQWRR